MASKYEINTMRARAIENVGNNIEWHIQSLKDEISNTEESLKEYRQQVAEGNTDCEWRIASLEKDIEQSTYEKEYWELAQKTIDKELMF